MVVQSSRHHTRSSGQFDAGLGPYLRSIREFPVLKADEEVRLARRLRETGDNLAAQNLVNSHLRLVAKVAMGYRGYGMPIADLISEGNVGMMQAVHRFDPERGFRLATYAIWWIRAAIQEYILKSWSLVRMGTTAAQKRLFFNLRRLKSELEILSDTDMGADKIITIAKRLEVTPKDVVGMNRYLDGSTTSLNDRVRGDSMTEWQDWLADDRPDQERTLAERENRDRRRAMLRDAIATLNERERHILVARRLSDDPVTLEDLSQTYGISRERVRQIEGRAFEKVSKMVRRASKPPFLPAHAAMPQATRH